MKKFKLIALLLVLTMSVGFFGCGSNEDQSGSSAGSNAEGASNASNEGDVSEGDLSNDQEDINDDTVIRVGGLSGPTSIGMVKLMKDSKDGKSENNYEFTIEAGADALTTPIIKGELDIAAVPSNLAAVLYNKTNGKVKLLAVNTLGVLYIVNRGETISVSDLKGKTLYATGKGAVPEYALRYVLSQNGIDPDNDLTIEWKSEATEIVSVLKNDGDAIAMLPQPFVTVASTQVEGLVTSIDLTAEWDKLGLDSKLITGTVVVRTEFAEEHPGLIEKFLDEYNDSIEYVNANIDEAAVLVEEFGIVKADVAKKAIPYCNIVFMAGEDMKKPVLGFLQVVYDQNSTAVGGTMPDDNFFY